METLEITDLIEKSIVAIEKRDALSLRKISSDAASEAAIEGHRELMLLSLVAYSIAKILSKVHYMDVKGSFYDKIIANLKKAATGPKTQTIEYLEAVEDIVIKLDRKEGNYEQNLIDKAKVKKAAKLYGQGFSLKKASELTGAIPTEVLDYVGGSKIHEFHGSGKNADRLRATREVFSG
jgi:hypothetical protein